MRDIRKNTLGSIYPVLMVIIAIAIAGFLVLIFGEVLTPFFQLGSSYDDTVAANVSEARGYMMALLAYIWPKGVLLVILFGLLFWMLMSYQKTRYKEM